MTARLATLLALIPATAFAHPGHGTTDPDGWTHYVTEPIHIISFTIAAAATVAIVAALRRAKRDRNAP